MSLIVNATHTTSPDFHGKLRPSLSEGSLSAEESTREVLQIDKIARLEFRALCESSGRRLDWTKLPEVVSRQADWVAYLGTPPPGSVDEQIVELETEVKALLAVDLTAASAADLLQLSKDLANVESKLGHFDPEALQRSALKRYEQVHHLCSRLSGSLQAAAAPHLQSSLGENARDDGEATEDGSSSSSSSSESRETERRQQQRRGPHRRKEGQRPQRSSRKKPAGQKASIMTISQEQQAITDFPHSLFLQGRSGTGKTLVITRRIGKRRRQAVADGTPLPTQLFITKSSLLKEEVLKELSGGYPAQPLNSWPPSGLHCATWDDLITVMGRKVHEVRPATINYDRFLSAVWPSLATPSRELPPHMVWAEFNTRLRPFRPAWAAPALTAGEYKRSDRSAVGIRLEPEDQMAMYEDFLKYTKWKESHNYQDDVDVAVLLRRHCSGLGLVDEVYIDEAQDFSPAQLMALISLCGRPDGVTVAGDTCQTINPGSAFSFPEIRAAFLLHWDGTSAWGESSEAEAEEIGSTAESAEAKEEAAREKKEKADLAAQCGMFTLRYNYRCAAGVAGLAGATVKLLLRRFPGAADYVEEETCLDSQPRLPIFVQLPRSHPADVLMGVGASRLPWLDPTKVVILVRDDAARRRLREHGEGVRGTILTVAEAKGLEFDLVILCGLIGDCDGFSTRGAGQQELWKLADDGSTESRAVFVGMNAPDFRAVARMGFKTHRLVCRMVQGMVEFKSLYVAVTRAKLGCAFLECGTELTATPLLERWSKSGLLKVWSGRKEYDSGIESSLHEATVAPTLVTPQEEKGDVASELKWIQMEMVRRHGPADKEARVMLSKERQRVQASGIADDRFRHRFWQYYGGGPSPLASGNGSLAGGLDELDLLQAQIRELEARLRTRGDKQVALSGLTSLLVERSDNAEAAASSGAVRTSCVAMMVLPLLEFISDHLADKSKNVAAAAELLTTSCLAWLDAEVIGATLPKLFARCRAKPKAGERLLRIATATIDEHGDELGFHATAAAVLEAERLVMDLREEVRLASQRCLESVILRAQHIPRILRTSNWPGLKAKLFQYVRELEQWTLSQLAATTSASDLALLLLVIEKNVRYQDAGGRLLQNLCASPIAAAASEAIELLQPTLTKHGLHASAEAINGLKRGSSGLAGDLPSLVPAMEKYFRSGGGRAGDDLGSKLQDLCDRGSQLFRHACDDPRERWPVFAEAHQIFVQARSFARIVFNTQIANNGRRAAPATKLCLAMDQSWRAQLATILEMASWAPSWRSDAPCRKLRSLRLWFNIFSFLSADWDTLCLIAERVVDHVALMSELQTKCVAAISSFSFERANHEAAPLAREESLSSALSVATRDLEEGLARTSRAEAKLGKPSEETCTSLLKVLTCACELQSASQQRAASYSAAGRGFAALGDPRAPESYSQAAVLLGRSLATLRQTDVAACLAKWQRDPLFLESLQRAASGATGPFAKKHLLKAMLEQPLEAYNEMLSEMKQSLAREASIAADLGLRYIPKLPHCLSSPEGLETVRRAQALFKAADRPVDAAVCAAVLGSYETAFQLASRERPHRKGQGRVVLWLSSAALGLGLK